MVVGPGKEAALDTLESVAWYCPEPHTAIIIDDCTQDGTYEDLLSQRRPNWQILRNRSAMGYARLTHSLCFAYRSVLSHTSCSLILKLDTDSLIIKPDVLSDALTYAREHPRVGMFGVHTCDYNRPRSFEYHTQLLTTEMNWRNWFKGTRPAYASLLRRAERRGYRRGDNVFGGAYFVTRNCLDAMLRAGALDLPYAWHSHLMEDVYFSIATVAAGYQLGHFAAPDGPLCLEWEGLPYPALELAESKYKVIHSLDKGRNTGRDDNNGRTAREVFKQLRSFTPELAANKTDAAISSAPN